MICPYNGQLNLDMLYKPIGPACYTCVEYDCEHNANVNNPDIIELHAEYAILFQEEVAQ